MNCDVNAILEYAINEMYKVKTGEIILVKDLFKGYEWNRIPRSDRLLLGILFLNKIRSMDLGVKAIEKTSSGQQKYLKL